METPSQPTAPSPEPQQELPGFALELAQVGADQVPDGFSGLKKRQQAFVLAYLRTGNQTESARIAGYSSPASDGCKAMRTVAIARVLSHCGREVAKSADQLVRRVSERSRTLHALYEAERDKPATLRSENTLIKLAAAVDKTDALLGQLIGKINGLHVSGTIRHDHTGGLAVTVPDTALPALAQMRRDVITHRTEAASRN